MTKTKQSLVSLVVPVYNEEAVLDIFFKTLQPILETCQKDYHVNFEYVFVNDGSTDQSLELLKKYREQNTSCRIISFSRNFGKELATTAGLDVCRGDAAIPIDADLQDDVHILPKMIAYWKEGYKIVLPIRKDRHDSFLKKKTGALFYWLINKISKIEIPKNAGDFRLMDRQVIDIVKIYQENNRFMRGIFASIGFKVKTIHFYRPKRVAGQTKYNYIAMIRYALEGITGFSTSILKIWTYVGSLVAFGAFSYGLFIISETLFFGEVPKGYPSLMTVMLFLGGIQLMSMGILGEYVGRIFIETKKRPLYIIEEKIGFDELT